MIEVSGESDGRQGRAWYSPCETYRYGLERRWAPGGTVLFVMLNPSTADALRNDPTIERCERRAGRLGYGSFGVVNLFGLRETSPAKLKAAEAPEGRDNMAAIEGAVKACDHVLAAWGVHGAHRDQSDIVNARLREMGKPLFHLGLTKDGHPRHPLYISYDTPLIPWV